MTTPQRAALVIDYQNVHNTARDVFGGPKALLPSFLIDPLKFAQELERIKASNGRPTKVTHIEVFRGLPDPSLPGHAYNTAQRNQWLQSVSNTVASGAPGVISPAMLAASKQLPTMTVELRPLRYPKIWDNSKQKYISDTSQRGVEKGIDVLAALALVRLAQQEDIDTVILASQDTDLIPAIDVAKRSAHIETARWYDSKDKTTHGSMGNVWVNRMDINSFSNSRDTRNYQK